MTKKDLFFEQIHYSLLDITTDGKMEEDVAYKPKDTMKLKHTEKNYNC